MSPQTLAAVWGKSHAVKRGDYTAKKDRIKLSRGNREGLYVSAGERDALLCTPSLLLGCKHIVWDIIDFIQLGPNSHWIGKVWHHTYTRLVRMRIAQTHTYPYPQTLAMSLLVEILLPCLQGFPPVKTTQFIFLELVNSLHIKCNVFILPFFEGFFSHFTSCSANFFWNGIFLRLGHLVDLVACIQTVGPSFASQSCSVSAT